MSQTGESPLLRSERKLKEYRGDFFRTENSTNFKEVGVNNLEMFGVAQFGRKILTTPEKFNQA
jgi:hypothetical protein